MSILNRTSETYNVAVATPGAFTGGSANTRGDHDGTNDPTTLFTVTGDVAVKVYGVCTVGLVGATATIEVGVTGDTAALIAQSTGSDLIANEIWFDATPTTKVAASSDITEKIIPNGLDIIETLGTADLTAGSVYYVCQWRPLTPNASVVAA